MSNTVTKKKLLIVDDDENHLASLRAFLDEYYETVTASSGKYALELIDKGYVPNLVLLDIIMPHMCGWEVYREMKAKNNFHDIPVVFYTYLSGGKEKKHALAIGAVDFLVKPYKKDDLLQKIETIFASIEKALKQEGI